MKFKNLDCTIKIKPFFIVIFTWGFLAYMAFQYHCQHKQLRDSIKTYDTNIKLYQDKLDEVIEQHNKMFDVCDSLIQIMDELPLGSPLDTLEISSNYGSRKNALTALKNFVKIPPDKSPDMFAYLVAFGMDKNHPVLKKLVKKIILYLKELDK